MQTNIESVTDRLYRWSTNPVIIVTGISLLLLIISFATSSFGMSYDEGYYNYIGYAWLKHHIPPYIGTWDNKNPPIFLLYGISSVLFGPNFWFPRLLGILALTTTSVLVFAIARMLYSQRTGILAMLLFGLTITWKSTGGRLVAQTESFMVLLVVLAFYILVRAFFGKESESYPNVGRLFLAGLSMGGAIAFKQSGVFCAAGLFLFYLSLALRKSYQIKSILRDFLVMGTGMIISIAASLIPLFLSGLTLADYYQGAWQNLFLEGSPTATPLVVRITRFLETFWQTKIVLFYPLILLFILQRKKLKQSGVPVWGILAWMIFDFLAVNASSTYATHLLKLLAPSFALASGIAIGSVFDSGFQRNKELIPESEKPKRFVQLLIIVAILWIPIYIEPVAAARKILFPRDDSGRTVMLCQEPYPRPEDNDLKRLGLWIKENSQKGDLVYIASYGAPAQAYSERISPSRYFDSIFLRIPGAGQELINDLLRKKPRLILIPRFHEYKVWAPKEVRDLIDQVVQNDYKYRDCHYGYEVYERR